MDFFGFFICLTHHPDPLATPWNPGDRSIGDPWVYRNLENWFYGLNLSKLKLIQPN